MERLERYYIEDLKPTLNKQIPTRTNKEYKQENKEQIKEQRKEYIELNKEKIYTKKLEKVSCECGCDITRNSLSRHKQTTIHINLMKLMEQDAN